MVELYGSMSTFKKVYSEIAQGSVLDLVYVQHYQYDLNKKIEGMLITFAYNKKLGGLADTPENRLWVEKDLDI